MWLNFSDLPYAGSSLTCFLNVWYYCYDKVRMPINNVRKPIFANSFNSLSKFNYDFDDNLCFTILSAPFVYIFMWPFSRIMMLILLRSELNGKTSKSYTVFYCPLIFIVACCFVLLMNSNPINLAASTNAISSGDGPW